MRCVFTGGEICYDLYYIQDGKLIADKHSYDRVSDKSMTFDEMNNGRGYPEPK